LADFGDSGFDNGANHRYFNRQLVAFREQSASQLTGIAWPKVRKSKKADSLHDSLQNSFSVCRNAMNAMSVTKIHKSFRYM
jgi:hypothetical protein